MNAFRYLVVAGVVGVLGSTMPTARADDDDWEDYWEDYEDRYEDARERAEERWEDERDYRRRFRRRSDLPAGRNWYVYDHPHYDAREYYLPPPRGYYDHGPVYRSERVYRPRRHRLRGTVHAGPVDVYYGPSGAVRVGPLWIDW